LAALRVAAADNTKILDLAAKLDPYAAGMTPTFAQLRDSLAIEEKAAPPPAAEGDVSSFEARFKTILQTLITVRPLHDPRFANLEKALDSGDGAGALEALKALPPEVQKSLSAWQAKLEARIDLDSALAALTAYFTTPSPQKGGL
jgi:hypothetical protein